MELKDFLNLQFEIFEFYKQANEASLGQYRGEPIAFAMDDVQLKIVHEWESNFNDYPETIHDVETFLLKDFVNKEDFFRRLREAAIRRSEEREAKKRREEKEREENKITCFKLNTPEQKLAVFNQLKEELGL